MQWDESNNAGFSDAEPWLPIAPDYADYNVARERDDPDSFLTLHQRLIGLRQSEPALNAGSYTPRPADDDVLAYIREAGGQRFLVALNLSDSPQTLPLSADLVGTVALTTHLDREGEDVRDTVKLRPDEGVVVRLS
jgi:alpha-glucosidase